MTADQRMTAAELNERLAAAGLSVTWQPSARGWRRIALSIRRQEPLPSRPTVYDPAVLRAIHAVDAAAARATMRAAVGWLVAPHGDDDFEATLVAWETGACGDRGDGKQHWVAARRAASGRGRGRVDVAHCKDCGLPVYAICLDPETDETSGWRPIWPQA